MRNEIGEADWHFFIDTIKDNKCTAFIGPGVHFGVLPLGSQVANEWAQLYNYPLPDRGNLAEVAQYLSIHYDLAFVKDKIVKMYAGARPDFTQPDEPHRILAGLPFSVYVTTNYDDFMASALRSCNKSPVRELCRWNEYLKRLPSIFDSNRSYVPTPENPIVFHLHGHTEVPESLVLTEDDHLDFLWNMSNGALLPSRIQDALATTSIIFIGYGLRDWPFRVLFRGIWRSTDPNIRRISIAQLVPWQDSTGEQQQRFREYMKAYFYRMGIRIYWGAGSELLQELRTRWKQSLSQDQSVHHLQPSNNTGEQEDVIRPMPSIFLSYAREDRTKVEALYNKLTEAGFKPWMDKYNILPGERWKTSIRNAIQDADFFLACLSKSSVSKRGYLQREFKEALDLWKEKLESDIYLIPIRLDDCQIPDSLGEFQWLDIFEESGFKELIHAIETGMKRRTS